MEHLEIVLQLLKNRLFAEESKCAFGQKQVEYLGYIITGEGVNIDPNKIFAMENWPEPNNLKELRGFLDLTTTTGSLCIDQQAFNFITKERGIFLE